MKTFSTDNQALMELLAENGFDLTCDEQMGVIISDEDAEKIPAFVDERAPFASFDYEIGEC